MNKALAPLIGAVLLLAGCAEPVPTGKRHYVGTWEADNMVLVIRPDGMLSYARQEGNRKTSVDGPIKHFDGADIVAGIGWFTTTFEVSVPPRVENGEWIMVVDEVRLRRTGTFEMPAPAGSADDPSRI